MQRDALLCQNRVSIHHLNKSLLASADIRESRMCWLVGLLVRFVQIFGAVSCRGYGSLHFQASLLGCSSLLRSVTFNRTLQPTAGRFDVSLRFMKARPFQSMLAPTSGG